MDDLACLLETSFNVSNDRFSTSAAHPRFSQYKSKTAGASDQEIRRKRKLEQQKQARHDYQDHVRNLAQGRVSSMDTEQRQKYRGGKSYRDQLMMSEWMVEVPQDFEENWVMVPCPVGKRTLVVASYGQTSSWSKGGWLIGKFPSVLPGGCRNIPHWNRDSTVLDCIYSELHQTYYVLDMMCWGQQPQYECETEFRFYWMATKMEEFPELKQITRRNKFKFDLLPNFSCKAENIQNVLKTKMNVQLDGLLFFHKQTHYTIGSTPLVTWLKPYMVPDILGIEIGEEHMRYKPVTYTTFEAHLEKVKIDKEKAEEKQKARLQRRKQQKSGQEMDTTPVKETTSGALASSEQHARHDDEAVTCSQGQSTASQPMASTDVKLQGEEDTLDFSQSDVPPAIQSDNIRSESVILIGDDCDSMEDDSQGVGATTSVTSQRRSNSANVIPSEQVAAPLQDPSNLNDQQNDERSIGTAPGVIRIPKSTTKVNKGEVTSAGDTAFAEGVQQKDKKKPKKLRGTKAIKGRAQ